METLGRWGTFLLKSFLDSSGVSIMICCISNSFYFRSNVWKDGRALWCTYNKTMITFLRTRKNKGILGWKARVGAIFKKVKKGLKVDHSGRPNRNRTKILRKSYFSSMKNDLTQIIERKVFQIKVSSVNIILADNPSFWRFPKNVQVPNKTVCEGKRAENMC